LTNDLFGIAANSQAMELNKKFLRQLKLAIKVVAIMMTVLYEEYNNEMKQ